MLCIHCSTEHNPFHCLVPPYITDELLKSTNAKVRAAASRNLAIASEFRARRDVYRLAPQMGISDSPVMKKHRLVYDAQGQSTLPGKLARSEGGPPSKDKAVNQAYSYSGDVYDFYSKLFKRNSLDDNGMTLVSSVHVGEFSGPMNNAFWDGTQMAYGDGDGIIFTGFTNALDVVSHELTHGVQSFTSNLEYRGQSGALNEHFSDVFGVLVRQWKKKQPANKANWLIGDDIIVKAPKRRAIRDMENPGTAYVNDPDMGSDPQPAHMKKIYTGQADHGGVHVNSGIPNRAFVLAAKGLGGNAWVKAGNIWFETMVQLSTNSQFADCARVCRQIANSQGAAVAKVIDDAWIAVGL
jgi:Zn-dependent metalloprotease